MDKCPENKDTCRTCGDKHHTSMCKSVNKLYCVLYLDMSHASWDRSCPEFIRWCKIINKCNPVNNMPFFLAEQDWTLAIRPARVSLEECFPTTFSVNSLLLHGRRHQGTIPKAKQAQVTGVTGRKEPPHVTADDLTSSNCILVLEKNKYAVNSTAPSSEYKEPLWYPTPNEYMGSGTWENDNNKGEVTQRPT